MFIKKTKNKGFTLIELLTVMAIFAVISASVLANYKDFGQNSLLKNLAYNISLAIREAQVSGLTGRNTELSSGNYYYAYGIYFSKSTPRNFIFFRDNQTTGTPYVYDSGTESVKTYDIKGRFRITDLCVYPVGGSTCNSVTDLNIVFKRPEPDAYIRESSFNGFRSRAKIEVTADNGKRYYVDVGAAGYISVVK